MAKNSDPTKDPEFQKAVQGLLRTPHKPHKPLGKAMRTIRRRLEFTLSTGTKALDLHQLSHALFASMNATRRKLGTNPPGMLCLPISAAGAHPSM
jgi:hypothetical protein